MQTAIDEPMAGYPEPLRQAAELARALAHPARLRILQLLAARRSCVCGTLVDALPLAQSTVSRHLKELKAAGLIRGEIAGPSTCYCLDEGALAEAGRLLAGVLGVPGRNGGHTDEERI